MQPDMRTVMKMKACKNPKQLLDVCTRIYLSGFADAQDAKVIPDSRLLHIKEHTNYEMTCPECGAVLLLDMEDLLKQEEGD